MDHSKTIYSETFGNPPNVGFKIYRYDPTGNHEQIIYRSLPSFRDKTDAENAAADYCEGAGIEAEAV